MDNEEIKSTPTTSGPVLQAGYPVYKRDRNNQPQKVYLYKIDKTIHKSYIPNDNANDPEGERGYSFQNINFTPDTAPGVLNMQVTYGPVVNGGSGSTQVGGVYYEGGVSMMDRDIALHPRYGDQAFQDWLKTTYDDKGLDRPKSYLMPAANFQRTEIFSYQKQSITEAFFLGNICQKGAPPGLSGANGDNWVMSGRSVKFGNNVYEVTDTYMWNPDGWKGIDWGQLKT